MEYNLANIYASIFAARPYPEVYLQRLQSGNLPFNKGEDYKPESYIIPPNTADWIETSVFGTEVYNPIYLDGKKFSDMMTIAIRRQKHITRQAPIGGRRSVKELIGFDDYEITIRGVLDGGNTYPQQLMAELNELEGREAAVKIECGELNAGFDFNQIVIISITWLEGSGGINQKGFEITAISDGIQGESEDYDLI